MRAPRAYQQNLLGDRNWSLKATYVEIYNEQLRDLLVPDSTPTNERTNIAIREDTKGNIILTGLRQVDINSVDDLMNALSFGSNIRQTDATAINAKSSRSHAVFSLNLLQRKSKLQVGNGVEKRFSMPLEAMTGQEMAFATDSKLHFVDLAGSERLKNTGAQGERAKEGISINAGLASLGKVISQLSSRQPGSHVSYRDSKLTRLLQDSLGGNAYTYMIACVTPAEFHLSETLNTVQYAQRARAIQSKPQIQQVSEGDSKALVERLRAEVSFLRDQIRSSQGGLESPRRGPVMPSERFDRPNERETELQDQLLDAQENYSALSHRHAKLIAELAKAREEESHAIDNNDDTSADDRLNRSNSFAQAVEQMVLEYEKTIQSLEHSLSSTRTTLSNTETSLLEKETKCAYVETINGQLQTRLQKLTDREADTENYLHDLESKLDCHTSGEEKSTTVITELRKEIARVLENEAACEDYISTLEERLAEADQDAELMQREVDRLEQVVERQRSLGKLDALLHELDHVEEGKPAESESLMHATTRGRHFTNHSRSPSHVSRRNQTKGLIIEERPDHEPSGSRHDAGASQEFSEAEIADDSEDPNHGIQSERVVDNSINGRAPQTTAQTKFVADKLETVTRELVDLRVEHESTVYEYGLLQSKYETALRSLSQLRDAVDEARHPEGSKIRDSVVSASTASRTRPDSFESGHKLIDTKGEPRSSMSRSLSSELSSAMESPATVDTSAADPDSGDDTATTKPTLSSEDLSNGAPAEKLVAEIARLRRLAEDKETVEKTLAAKYAELESTHNETLDMVEELKTEMSKARAVEATSPRTSAPVIRRKSSQNLMVIDRAHRSFASLRNIASENFEEQPEVMQNFELNLNSAMHELHSRSERIQELEADITSVKKEMETKMTIISGLTRERSSLKASPMDMSMVANLRDQLERNEKQMAQMREIHDAREKELTLHIEELRISTQALAPPSASEAGGSETESNTEQRQRISELEDELSKWEAKQRSLLESREIQETELRDKIEKLEAHIASSQEVYQVSLSTAKSANEESSQEVEKQHQKLVAFLRSEIDEYKTIINSNVAKVTELESEYATAKSKLEELTVVHGVATVELERHHQLVADLEEKLSAVSEASKAHQEALRIANESHSKELADFKTREQKSYEEQVEVLMQEHADAVHIIEEDLSRAKEDLNKIATQIAVGMDLEVSIDMLSERVAKLLADQQTLAAEQWQVEEMRSHLTELTAKNAMLTDESKTIRGLISGMLAEDAVVDSASITAQLAALKTKLHDLDDRNAKNSRLVEELEEQLQNNFDEAQLTNNRLSTLQTERSAQLDEAISARTKLQTDLDSIREEHASLQARYQELSMPGEIKRSNSNSTIRKSSSHTSLPSPPPAIPLPPLPGMAGRSASPTNGAPVSQLTEDQEARIRTIEKHLFAERQLTQTLEEALTDLEKQSKKINADCEAWKKRAHELETELKEAKDRQPEAQTDNRWSMQAVEEERKKRQAAELARKQLEERMNAINKGKKKKGSLNCF